MEGNNRAEKLQENQDFWTKSSSIRTALTVLSAIPVCSGVALFPAKSMVSTCSHSASVAIVLFLWLTVLFLFLALRFCSLFQGSLRLSVRTRCGFQESEVLRSGSVRFKEIVILTARFGAVWFPDIVNSTVRFGAVFTNQKSYGAVRRGFPLNWSDVTLNIVHCHLSYMVHLQHTLTSCSILPGTMQSTTEGLSSYDLPNPPSQRLLPPPLAAHAWGCSWSTQTTAAVVWCFLYKRIPLFYVP